MTQATIIEGLTRDDITALRKADTISFVLSPATSYIACSFNGADGKEQSRREINVEHHLATYDNEKGARKPLAEVAVCHYFMATSKNDELWQTIASVLRTGDCVSLLWLRSAMTNNYMREAGLFGDRLDLLVERKNNKPGSRTKRLRFTLATQCCQDNTARMIRRGAFNNE